MCGTGAFLDNGWDVSYGARYGGALYVSRGNVHLEGCTLTGNHGYFGGAVYSWGLMRLFDEDTQHQYELTVRDSTLADNDAGHAGGLQGRTRCSATPCGVPAPCVPSVRC